MAKLTKEDRTPPQAAANNAQRALDWRKEHGDEVKGGTIIGWTRANQIAKRETLSIDTIKRIKAFIRHEKNSEVAEQFKDTPWRDAGHVAWQIWGGSAAIKDWAPKVVAKYESKE